MKSKCTFLLTLLILLTSSCREEESNTELMVKQIFIGPYELSLTNKTLNIPIDQSITLIFSSSVSSLSGDEISIVQENQVIDFAVTAASPDNIILLYPTAPLKSGAEYTIYLTDRVKAKSGGELKPMEVTFQTQIGKLELKEVLIDDLVVKGRATDISFDPEITVVFKSPVKPETVTSSAISLMNGNQTLPISLSLDPTNTRVFIKTVRELEYLTKYTISISDFLKGKSGEIFSSYIQTFYTTADPTPKFPIVSDDELLTLVQHQTFKYFYDFAHPASGMARERNASGNLVTSGGSGFGIMALVVGMERNFITRPQGINRLTTIVTFLEKADRFRGAWAHWMDGNTGKVIPFSAKDNGGDLVETSFLVQGLLTARQYLLPADTSGNNLINRITALWEGVEWDWYRRGGQEVLYWHWSPSFGWDMNFALSGYFEQQITYLLAAASPTHGIPKSVYTNGFAENGNIVRNNTYYGIPLKLGGLFPLFWTQYSYLGLDPHFSDGYANYWEQNRNASLINRAYCVANPRNYVAYSEQCWGLTSSDGPGGYNSHSPANDTGVVTPTAALSAFPYTPEESMQALKFFYYTLGDRLWGPYGFYDAFDITEGWVADSYLAIDQGPIICMIENHRTGLLWNLFMSAPEVQQGVSKLGFSY